jgi:hypothetical protein
VLQAAQETSSDPLYDLSCDGAVGLDDVSIALAASRTVAPVGPSGHACQGTPPTYLSLFETSFEAGAIGLDHLRAGFIRVGTSFFPVRFDPEGSLH